MSSGVSPASAMAFFTQPMIGLPSGLDRTWGRRAGGRQRDRRAPGAEFGCEILGHRGERETRMVLVKATRCGGAQQVVIAHRPVGARRLGERLANRPLDLGRSDR